MYLSLPSTRAHICRENVREKRTRRRNAMYHFHRSNRREQRLAQFSQADITWKRRERNQRSGTAAIANPNFECLFRISILSRWHWQRGRSSLSVITLPPTLDHLVEAIVYSLKRINEKKKELTRPRLALPSLLLLLLKSPNFSDKITKMNCSLFSFDVSSSFSDQLSQRYRTRS